MERGPQLFFIAIRKKCVVSCMYDVFVCTLFFIMFAELSKLCIRAQTHVNNIFQVHTLFVAEI